MSSLWCLNIIMLVVLVALYIHCSKCVAGEIEEETAEKCSKC